MKRRHFITLAAAAAALPHAALAQSGGKIRQIGVLMPTAESDPEMAVLGDYLRRELQGLGWTGGRNLRIAYRWGSGDATRIRSYASELVTMAPDVILAGGVPAVAPLHRLTDHVPIVFVSVSDPVGQGLVKSLAHPGGNITGFTNFDPATGGKWLSLLKEAAPAVKRVGVLYNPATAPYTKEFISAVEAAAGPLKVAVVPATVQDDGGIDTAIAALGKEPGGGLIVPSDGYTYARYEKIVAAATRANLPAIYPFRSFTTSGGLMSYGVDLVGQLKQAAHYIDRILSGDQPADLPVLQPQKFDLILNVKTAKALGLDLPQSLIARADEVLQ